MNSNAAAARQAVELFVCSPGRANAERAGDGPSNLPAVAKALAHYGPFAEDRDFAIDLYRVPSPAGDLLVLAVVPDGNDGWFAAFTADGTALGEGQFAGDRAAWGESAEVRDLAARGGTLPALNPPLEWTERKGKYRSACGRFTISRVGNAWRLDQMPEQGTHATLADAQSLAQQLAPWFGQGAE